MVNSIGSSSNCSSPKNTSNAEERKKAADLAKKTFKIVGETVGVKTSVTIPSKKVSFAAAKIELGKANQDQQTEKRETYQKNTYQSQAKNLSNGTLSTRKLNAQIGKYGSSANAMKVFSQAAGQSAVQAEMAKYSADVCTDRSKLHHQDGNTVRTQKWLQSSVSKAGSKFGEWGSKCRHDPSARTFSKAASAIGDGVHGGLKDTAWKKTCERGGKTIAGFLGKSIKNSSSIYKGVTVAETAYRVASLPSREERRDLLIGAGTDISCLAGATTLVAMGPAPVGLLMRGTVAFGTAAVASFASSEIKDRIQRLLTTNPDLPSGGTGLSLSPELLAQMQANPSTSGNSLGIITDSIQNFQNESEKNHDSTIQFFYPVLSANLNPIEAPAAPANLLPSSDQSFPFVVPQKKRTAQEPPAISLKKTSEASKVLSRESKKIFNAYFGPAKPPNPNESNKGLERAVKAHGGFWINNDSGKLAYGGMIGGSFSTGNPVVIGAAVTGIIGIEVYHQIKDYMRAKERERVQQNEQQLQRYSKSGTIDDLKKMNRILKACPQLQEKYPQLRETIKETLQENGRLLWKESRWGKVQSAHKAGKLDEALKNLDRLGKSFPNDVEIFQTAGYLHLKQNKHELAKADYGSAKELAPNDWNALYGLGMAYLGLKNSDSASVYFDQAGEVASTAEQKTRADAEWLECKSEKADALFKAGKKIDALKICREILGKDENNFTANAMLGSTCVNIGAFSEAKPHLLKALKANPNNPHLLQKLATAHYEEKDFLSATERLVQAREFESDLEQKTLLEANLRTCRMAEAAKQLNKDNIDGAKPPLEAIVAENPTDSEANLTLLDISLAEQKFENAKKYGENLKSEKVLKDLDAICNHRAKSFKDQGNALAADACLDTLYQNKSPSIWTGIDHAIAKGIHQTLAPLNKAGMSLAKWGDDRVRKYHQATTSKKSRSDLFDAAAVQGAANALNQAIVYAPETISGLLGGYMVNAFVNRKQYKDFNEAAWDVAKGTGVATLNQAAIQVGFGAAKGLAVEVYKEAGAVAAEVYEGAGAMIQKMCPEAIQKEAVANLEKLAKLIPEDATKQIFQNLEKVNKLIPDKLKNIIGQPAMIFSVGQAVFCEKSWEKTADKVLEIGVNTACSVGLTAVLTPVLTPLGASFASGIIMTGVKAIFTSPEIKPKPIIVQSQPQIEDSGIDQVMMIYLAVNRELQNTSLPETGLSPYYIPTQNYRN